MVIKKQADTDRDDAPLAVVKQTDSSDTKAKASSKPKAEKTDKATKTEPKPGSILARLIGR